MKGGRFLLQLQMSTGTIILVLIVLLINIEAGIVLVESKLTWQLRVSSVCQTLPRTAST